MRASRRPFMIVTLSLVIIAALGSPSSVAAPSVIITSPVGLTNDPTPLLSYTAQKQ